MTYSDLNNLPPLSIPAANLKISSNDNGSLKVFDAIRKKYVVLTPEEWVRQNFVHWMVECKGYPLSLIANETEINLNGTKKRCDTVIYGRDCNPLIILEFKAPGVEITQNTFDQIVRYNMALKAKYLIVSNGLKSFCCVLDYVRNSYNFIPVIPDYFRATGMLGEN